MPQPMTPAPPAQEGIQKLVDLLRREAVPKAQELAGSLFSSPASLGGAGMRAGLAGVRSVLPGGGTYDEERARIAAADDQRYPGISSVIPEVRDPAVRQAAVDDVSQAAMAAPVLVHNSPRFWTGAPSLEHLGKGEGAQIRGHGIYAGTPDNLGGLYERYVKHLRDAEHEATLVGPGLEGYRLPEGTEYLVSHHLRQRARLNTPRDRAVQITLGAVKDALKDTISESFPDRKMFTQAERDKMFEVISALRAVRKATDIKLEPMGSTHLWRAPDEGVLKIWQTIGENPEAYQQVLDAMPKARRENMEMVRKTMEDNYAAEAPLRAADAAAGPFEEAKAIAMDPSTVTIEDALKWRNSPLDSIMAMNNGERGYKPEETAEALVKRGGFHSMEYMGEQGTYGHNPIQNYVIMDPSAVEPLGTWRTPEQLQRSEEYRALSDVLRQQFGRQLKERQAKGWQY